MPLVESLRDRVSPLKAWFVRRDPDMAAAAGGSEFKTKWKERFTHASKQQHDGGISS
jgi:hypothetical protein